MNRRVFFSAAVGTAALVAGGVHALAQQSQDHSGHGAAGIQYPKLASAAAECVLKGQECIDHCIGVVKAGGHLDRRLHEIGRRARCRM
jgi:hypothetical protein